MTPFIIRPRLMTRSDAHEKIARLNAHHEQGFRSAATEGVIELKLPSDPRTQSAFIPLMHSFLGNPIPLPEVEPGERQRHPSSQYSTHPEVKAKLIATTRDSRGIVTRCYLEANEEVLEALSMFGFVTSNEKESFLTSILKHEARDRPKVLAHPLQQPAPDFFFCSLINKSTALQTLRDNMRATPPHAKLEASHGPYIISLVYPRNLPPVEKNALASFEESRFFQDHLPPNGGRKENKFISADFAELGRFERDGKTHVYYIGRTGITNALAGHNIISTALAEQYAELLPTGDKQHLDGNRPPKPCRDR